MNGSGVTGSSRRGISVTVIRVLMSSRTPPGERYSRLPAPLLPLEGHRHRGALHRAAGRLERDLDPDLDLRGALERALRRLREPQLDRRVAALDRLRAGRDLAAAAALAPRSAGRPTGRCTRTREALLERLRQLRLGGLGGQAAAAAPRPAGTSAGPQSGSLAAGDQRAARSASRRRSCSRRRSSGTAATLMPSPSAQAIAAAVGRERRRRELAARRAAVAVAERLGRCRVGVAVLERGRERRDAVDVSVASFSPVANASLRLSRVTSPPLMCGLPSTMSLNQFLTMLPESPSLMRVEDHVVVGQVRRVADHHGVVVDPRRVAPAGVLAEPGVVPAVWRSAHE